jgi:hypothetical protein
VTQAGALLCLDNNKIQDYAVPFKKVDLNFRFVHFSNAYLAKPDEGFTVLYLLSLGYLI